jgi:hypothetical protein
MNNKELMEEIRILRKEQQAAHADLTKEMQELKKEFYIFKGKAFGFISLLTVIFNVAFSYVFHKK